VSGNIIAQKSKSLTIIYTDINEQVSRVTKAPKKDLYSIYLSHLEEGFYNCSIDSMKFTNAGKQLNAYLHLGKAYKAELIIFEEHDGKEIVATQNPQLLSTIIKQTISGLEQEGYPFASIKTEFTDSDADSIRFILDKGTYIGIDSIIGINSPVSNSFLINYLSIKKGEPYNELKVKNLRNEVNNSAFLKMVDFPSVIFIKDKAKIYLNLEKKKANQFDGILGIQPGESQRTTITGLVNLSLINSLKRGEQISINWERLLAESQRLKINLAIPYLFKTKLGLAFQANIIRQDSTLNRSILNYSVFYDFSSNSRLSIGFESATNNTNLSDQDGFQNTSTRAYNMTYSHKNLNNQLNPRSGFSTLVSGFIGERELGLDQKNQLINVKGRINYFVPLLKKTALLIQLNGESANSPELFNNELLQVGGLNFIRGVDQRSINVSSWLTGTLEYRFLFDESSNIFLFGEHHWNETRSLERYLSDQISAIGVGISVGTNSGIFSFNYALANQAENTFLFRNAKINFGFSSTF